MLAIERAVARLSAHKQLSPHIIFKGGFVLLKSVQSSRFTRDLDALAQGIAKDNLTVLVTEALLSDLDDGLWLGDVSTVPLAVDEKYEGIRFSFAFSIGDPPAQPHKIKKLPRIHLDCAFGDSVPALKGGDAMKSLLPSFEPVAWRVYPIEQIFAEKLQTVYERGSANSRAKDIYDIVYLYPRCADRALLAAAIRRTFSTRHTAIPNSFRTAVEALDTTVLEAAWKSILLMQTTIGFQECWTSFFEILNNLDGWFFANKL